MIVLDDVSYSYDGRTPALDGVSLRIPDGEFLCILGGNGSGKSTLAKHLNALLVPDAGTVLVDGIDTSDPEYVYDVRARVGYVFQNPDDQLVATLVADDVAFGPENLGLDPALIGERCEESLDEVGLTGFGRREAHALSGGQKQRVAIAGVLAMHPEVLVLDEASSMLDPRGRAGLMRVCRELHGQGMTVVMITHDMEEAALADRVAVLHRGRIALEGAPLDVLPRASELAHLNLAVPPACRLSLALAERGVAVGPEVDEDALVDRLAQMAAHPAAGAGAGTGGGDGARPDVGDLDPAVPRPQRDPGG
ncbi:energy-coupling factor transporter ATPase, partial [Candidatus Collinsella stercoripullorum]|uniref:energy-coupling factor transporter ATPase n=1 Tax=Candidatus Collinsella stercoripullorum TaxID=2838522 RepID=UPI0022E895A1